MMTVGIVSLGCSKNLVDSEIMLGLLDQNGYEFTNDPAGAEILIVNTCCFIESAQMESIEAILEMAQYKQTGKCRLLIVAGCLSQRYRDEILEEIPEIDILLGTANYHEIIDAINEYDKKTVRHFSDINFSPDYTGLPRYYTTPSYTGYLRISDGCNNCCSYCVIPSIRGKYRSRNLPELLSEAEDMVRRGAKELIIIGQDTTKYGSDLGGNITLSTLLNELCKLDGLKWIRVHYSYPEGITDELIETIKTQDKICKYLDIPIQHCNDEILKKMRRRYTKSELTGLLKKLRREIPGLVIRTSIIVGFPGETEEQFDELCEFIQEQKFERGGVFAYSREDGTPAAKMPGQVSEEIKEKRQEILMAQQSRIMLNQNKKLVGSIEEVLVEGYENDHYYGRRYADSIEIDGTVYFPPEGFPVLPGDIVRVKINDFDETDLFGEIV